MTDARAKIRDIEIDTPTIIQKNETQIAKEMIKTGAMQGDVINVDCQNGQYTFDIQGR